MVIRRIMAGLRDLDYVRSEKGHGGGWTLACDLSKVTLRDGCITLGSPTLLAMEQRTGAGCLVEQAVNAALDQAFGDAGLCRLSRFGEVTLAMLSDDLRKRLGSRKHQGMTAHHP